MAVITFYYIIYIYPYLNTLIVTNCAVFSSPEFDRIRFRRGSSISCQLWSKRKQLSVSRWLWMRVHSSIVNVNPGQTWIGGVVHEWGGSRKRWYFQLQMVECLQFLADIEVPFCFKGVFKHSHSKQTLISTCFRRSSSQMICLQCPTNITKQKEKTLLWSSFKTSHWYHSNVGDSFDDSIGHLYHTHSSIVHSIESLFRKWVEDVLACCGTFTL